MQTKELNEYKLTLFHEDRYVRVASLDECTFHGLVYEGRLEPVDKPLPDHVVLLARAWLREELERYADLSNDVLLDTFTAAAVCVGLNDHGERLRSPALENRSRYLDLRAEILRRLGG